MLVQNGGRCLFHNDESWRDQAEEIRLGIEAKIHRGDFNFEGYHFPEIDLFSEQNFKAPVNFRKARFHGSAIFSKARFSDYVDFRVAQFSGQADFSGARFLRANFGSANLGSISFHGAQFKGSTDFTFADFSNADFNSAKLTRPNFKDAHFRGRAQFNEAQFSGRADFDRAQFSNGAEFQEVKFLGRADFDRTQFLSRADFNGAKFKNAYFRGAHFKGRAYFRDTCFLNAYFQGARFSSAHFQNARFSSAHFRAHFSDAHFQGAYFLDADFSRAYLKGPAYFRDTHFSNADFSGAEFSGPAEFNKAQFSTANFENARFTDIVSFNNTNRWENDDKTISFWRGNFTNVIFEKTTTFKDAYLDPCFESTNMPHSSLRDIRWPQEKKLFVSVKKKLYDEREADDMENGLQKMRRYRKAVRTYFFLRTRLHAEGDFIDESDFFYRERLTQKKLLGTRMRLWFKDVKPEQMEEVKGLCGGLGWESLLEWLWLSFTWVTCGFGERILHIVGTSVLTWILSALLLLGLVKPCPHTTLRCLHDALYVSAGALSNMGVDKQKLAFSLSLLGQWLIQVEAIVGIILTSLFLVVFVRKMSRQ